MRSRSFAARQVGNVVIYVHTSEPPSDEEWDRVLSFYEGAASTLEPKILVYTEGSAPNAAQRARLNGVFGKRRVLLAILTSSALARAAGTAVHWFRPEVRVFGAREFPKAAMHLGLTPAEATAIESALNELKGELQLGAPAPTRER
ncbi:MAG TPA: hypothetical protein VFQ61_35785 [Polyangiaceae bacterium]|nr:hypothetical protein [Polyangiaceae bacterium]